MRVLRMGNNDVTGAGGGRNMLHKGHIETSHNKLVSRKRNFEGNLPPLWRANQTDGQ